MDELIRQLEQLAQDSLRQCQAGEADEPATLIHNGGQQAYMYATHLAREAKRRMADHEPAWDLQ